MSRQIKQRNQLGPMYPLHLMKHRERHWPVGFDSGLQFKYALHADWPALNIMLDYMLSLSYSLTNDYVVDYEITVGTRYKFLIRYMSTRFYTIRDSHILNMYFLPVFLCINCDSKCFRTTYKYRYFVKDTILVIMCVNISLAINTILVRCNHVKAPLSLIRQQRDFTNRG